MLSSCEVFQPAYIARESGCSFRKKREVRKEELKKNEGAILKFVNISSDAISPNEMH